jgi:hypothetical protein
MLLGDNASKMTPQTYSSICGTTAFLMFFIKEMLEYAGLLPDRKVNNLRIYKNMEYEEFITRQIIEKSEILIKVLSSK